MVNTANDDASAAAEQFQTLKVADEEKISNSAGGANNIEEGAAAPPPPQEPAPQGTLPPLPPEDGIVVRLFVGDLAPHTTEASLSAYFEQWGTVVRALIKHPDGNNSSQRTRSFGFISVLGEATAQAILSSSHTIDGTNVGFPEVAKERRGASNAAGGRPSGGPPSGSGANTQCQEVLSQLQPRQLRLHRKQNTFSLFRKEQYK